MCKLKCTKQIEICVTHSVLDNFKHSLQNILFIACSPNSCLIVIINFHADPFADDNDTTSGSDRYIHIRIQQRNGRKTLTTVQGISSEFDLKKIVKVVKKVCKN